MRRVQARRLAQRLACGPSCHAFLLSFCTATSALWAEPARVDYRAFLEMELQRLEQMRAQPGLGEQPKEYITKRMGEIRQRLLGASDGNPGQMVQFMNTRAFGSRFVYVLDKSRSMVGERLAMAKAELMRSLSQFDPDKEFYVIFYDTKAYEMPGGTFLAATPANQEKCRKWLKEIHGKGMTNPSLAILRALQLKPDAVFLLSDGLFDSSVVTLIPRLREHLLDPEGDGVKEQEMQTLRINTIAFMSDEGGPLLERIACENDGQYVYVRPAPENEDSWFTWLRAQVGKWKDKAKDDGDRGKENGRETQEDERGGE